MSVANHEGSKITFSGQNLNGTSHSPTIGVDIHDIAFQTASVSSKTNNEPITAIGYRGVAAISDLIGSVECSLDGILTMNPDFTPYLNRGTKGLLNKDLNDLVSQWGDIVIETRGEDDEDNGQKCTMSEMYVTGTTFNFSQNASVTTTWNFVGYNCTWEDSLFDYDTDLVIADGTQFTPLASKDVTLTVTAPTGTAAGIQSVSFSATLNRTEVYEIGTLAPIDRPVTYPFEVTMNIEALADESTLLRNITPTYKWNNPSNPSTPNSFGVFVDHKESGQRICGSPYARPVDGSLNVSVGNNSSVTMSFSGWSFEF